MSSTFQQASAPKTAAPPHHPHSQHHLQLSHHDTPLSTTSSASSTTPSTTALPSTSTTPCLVPNTCSLCCPDGGPRCLTGHMLSAHLVNQMNDHYCSGGGDAEADGGEKEGSQRPHKLKLPAIDWLDQLEKQTQNSTSMNSECLDLTPPCLPPLNQVEDLDPCRPLSAGKA